MCFFCRENFVSCHILSLLYTCVILYRSYHSLGDHPKSWIFLPSSNITRCLSHWPKQDMITFGPTSPKCWIKKATFRKEQYTHDFKIFHPALPLTVHLLFQPFPTFTTNQPTNQRHQPPPLADDSALRQHRIPVRRSHQPPVLVGSHLERCSREARNDYKNTQGGSTRWLLAP